ncbi:Uncharacterised protein [BD1-7 clade bacterium]|nr:Uncharacterised protein [BD1-7 clade bacterium]
MRFSEVLQPENYPGGLVSIPNPVFVSMITEWCKAMGKKTGYRREKRIVRWQEAIDTAYTMLERELQTSDPKKITAHPKWCIMMIAAKTYFPEQIELYHPTAVEAERVGRIIHISEIKRHIRDKMELMRIIKEDRHLKADTFNELVESRMKCEVLAASAQMLVAKARASNFYSSDVYLGTDHDRGTESTAKRKGVGVIGTGKAHGSVSASATLELEREKLCRGVHHKGSMGVKAKVEGEIHGEGELSLAKLKASASAGLSAETSVSANVDYNITLSSKVPTEYLKRIFRDQERFNWAEFHAEGEANARVKANADFEASSVLAHKYHHKPVQDNYFSTHTDTDDTKEAFRLMHLTASAEAELGINITGSAGLRFFDSLDATLSGDIFGGARGIAEANLLINGRGIRADFNAAFFAGLEAGTNQKLTITHPSRKITIASFEGREAVSAGFGAQARQVFVANTNKMEWQCLGGITMGVGGYASFSSSASPSGILLLGYDFLVMPSILALADVMKRKDPRKSSVHTQRIDTLAKFLNNQASRGELNSVYLECHARMLASLGAMDAEADKLLAAKRQLREPGFDGYASKDLKDVSALRSAYIDEYHEDRDTPLVQIFGSEASEGNPSIQPQVPIGDMGRPITQTQHPTPSYRKSPAVGPVMQELQKNVTTYLNAKKGDKWGRIAFKETQQAVWNKEIADEYDSSQGTWV